MGESRLVLRVYAPVKLRVRRVVCVSLRTYNIAERRLWMNTVHVQVLAM